MEKMILRKPLLFEGKQYKPGEEVPRSTPEWLETWLENGVCAPRRTALTRAIQEALEPLNTEGDEPDDEPDDSFSENDEGELPVENEENADSAPGPEGVTAIPLGRSRRAKAGSQEGEV